MQDFDDREVQLALLRTELLKSVSGSKNGKVENQMVLDLTVKTNVSRNTIRRVLLLETPPKDYFPRMDTRELLVQYLGYSDWADFIRVMKQRDYTSHDLEQKTVFDSLPEDIQLPNKPFKYLQYYKREDARIFFGRGKAVAKLIDYLFSPLSEKVLLIYGQSGVGKSSFLTAGVLPRLEKNWKPLYFRLSKESSVLDEIELQKLNTPAIWVIDQAEVVFDPSINDPERVLSKVLRFTQMVLESREDDRILISFRKEYFAEFDALLDRQEIGFKKFYLEPLAPPEVREVIEGINISKSAQLKYELKIDRNLVEEITYLVSSDTDSPVAPTLQVILSKLWDESTLNGKWPPHFSLELFQKQFEKNGHILDDFIEERLDILSHKQRHWVAGGLAIDLLEFFVSPISTSEDRSKKEVLNRYGHINDIMLLIQEFINCHLIAEASSPEKAVFRLSHDALAPLIKSRFDSSVLVGQMARRLLTNRVFVQNLPAEYTQDSVFSISDLEIIEAGKLHTQKLSSLEEEFIKISLAFWESEGRKKRRRRFLFAGTLLGFLAAFLISIFLFRDNQKEQQDRADLLHKEVQTSMLGWDFETKTVLSKYRDLQELGYHQQEIELDLLSAVSELSFHQYIPTFKPFLPFADKAILNDTNRRLFFGEYAYLALLAKDTLLADQSLSYLSGRTVREFNGNIANDFQIQFAEEITKWDAKYFPEWIPVQLNPGDTSTIFLCSKTELTYRDITFFLNIAQLNPEWIEDSCSFFKRNKDGPFFQVNGWRMPPSASPMRAAQISWVGADLYCDWFGFDIPYEYEWIAAARDDWEAILANTSQIDSFYSPTYQGFLPTNFPQAMDSLAWTYTSARNSVKDVCTKSFPFFKFCDMFGNVNEWLQDSVFVNDSGALHRKFKGGSMAQISDLEIFSLEGVLHETIYTPIDVGLRPIIR